MDVRLEGGGHTAPARGVAALSQESLLPKTDRATRGCHSYTPIALRCATEAWNEKCNFQSHYAISEQLPCRSAEVKFFSVFFFGQECREIRREIW